MVDLQVRAMSGRCQGNELAAGVDGNEWWFHWCHGPAGIGFFFLRAWALTGNPTYRDIALAGARTISEVGHRGGTTLCHGLAGNGDFLLEVSRVLQEPRWFSDAVRIADILELWTPDLRNGGLTWPGDHPDVITPDFMVGCAEARRILPSNGGTSTARQPASASTFVGSTEGIRLIAALILKPASIAILNSVSGRSRNKEETLRTAPLRGAPQVGLEPTTLRLTTEDASITRHLPT